MWTAGHNALPSIAKLPELCLDRTRTPAFVKCRSVEVVDHHSDFEVANDPDDMDGFDEMMGGYLDGTLDRHACIVAKPLPPILDRADADPVSVTGRQGFADRGDEKCRDCLAEERPIALEQTSTDFGGLDGGEFGRNNTSKLAERNCDVLEKSKGLRYRDPAGYKIGHHR